jgi:hypothetical protein
MTQLVCARCFKAPEAPRARFDHMRGTDTDTWEHFCSEKCMHHDETPVERAARTGIALMNADLMFHMFLSIGRDDDDSLKIIQARRVLCAEILQRLAKTPELEAVAL